MYFLFIFSLLFTFTDGIHLSLCVGALIHNAVSVGLPQWDIMGFNDLDIINSLTLTAHGDKGVLLGVVPRRAPQMHGQHDRSGLRIGNSAQSTPSLT